MNKKIQPYLIKGGIVGSIVYLILLGLFKIFSEIDKILFTSFSDKIIFPLKIIEYFASIITENILFLPDKMGYIISVIIVFFIGAIIGAIIGFLIEKLKSNQTS